MLVHVKIDIASAFSFLKYNKTAGRGKLANYFNSRMRGIRPLFRTHPPAVWAEWQRNFHFPFRMPHSGNFPFRNSERGPIWYHSTNLTAVIRKGSLKVIIGSHRRRQNECWRFYFAL